jgi:hypothetical protein
MMAASVDTAPATDHTDILTLDPSSTVNCTLFNRHIAALVSDLDFYISFTRAIHSLHSSVVTGSEKAYFTLDRMGSYWQCKARPDHHELPFKQVDCRRYVPPAAYFTNPAQQQAAAQKLPKHGLIWPFPNPSCPTQRIQIC